MCCFIEDEMIPDGGTYRRTLMCCFSRGISIYCESQIEKLSSYEMKYKIYMK